MSHEHQCFPCWGRRMNGCSFSVVRLRRAADAASHVNELARLRQMGATSVTPSHAARLDFRYVIRVAYTMRAISVMVPLPYTPPIHVTWRRVAPIAGRAGVGVAVV